MLRNMLALFQWRPRSDAQVNALIGEYKVCNEIITASAGRCWQSAALLLGFAVTGAILVITRQQPAAPDMRTTIVVILIGLCTVVGFVFLWRFQDRENWRQHVVYARMKHIENELGCWIIRYIGTFDGGSEKEKGAVLAALQANDPNILKKYKESYTSESGWLLLKVLTGTGFATWLFVIFWQFLDTSWP
ncbi:MAG: hypothetical protein ABIH46_10075, partial [Chloroflexota bacterium]